jgi:transcriptional regulator with XRE-family HTH domain
MIPATIQEYDSNIQWQIGQRIQEKRIEKELAGADVAEYMNIRANQLSRIENGRANCTMPQMFILAQLLDCSVDYLMFGKKPESPYTGEQQDAIKNMLAAFRKV